MSGDKRVILVDSDTRRRAAISHCLSGSGIHVEPFEDIAELGGRWAQSGMILIHDTDDAIAAWKAAPRTTPGGQPHYSDLAITTALTLRAVFHLPLRQTQRLRPVKPHRGYPTSIAESRIPCFRTSMPAHRHQAKTGLSCPSVRLTERTPRLQCGALPSFAMPWCCSLGPWPFGPSNKDFLVYIKA